MENGSSQPNHSAQEIYDTALEIQKHVSEKYPGIEENGYIFDVGIAPLASDTEGMTKRTLDAIKMIRDDSTFKKISFSLGLSNFSTMLPSKTPDGLPVRSSLESAFITKARGAKS